jgi:Flp pilus assembly pilin Flp
MILLKQLIKEERGLETVEWVIMGGLIIVGIVVVVSLIVADIGVGVIVADIGVGVNALSDEVQTAISIGEGSSP